MDRLILRSGLDADITVTQGGSGNEMLLASCYLEQFALFSDLEHYWRFAALWLAFVSVASGVGRTMDTCFRRAHFRSHFRLLLEWREIDRPIEEMAGCLCRPRSL